jgi:hypothetical protein
MGTSLKPWDGPHQNSRCPPALARRGLPSVPLASSKSEIPRRASQAASVSAGPELTMSRIICHAAKLRAPSGGGPMASETEHWGQKQIRCAEDFCRGRTPTVWANMYTATDFCPDSSSRLQRRQYKFSKGASRGSVAKEHSVSMWWRAQVRRQILAAIIGEPSCALARGECHRALCFYAIDYRPVTETRA